VVPEWTSYWSVHPVTTSIELSPGRTDLPLTQNGVRRMQEAAKALVGEDRLLTSSTITQIFVSPRQRARQTLSILELPTHIPICETKVLAEWDYGIYEGITTNEIKASRPSGRWDIWYDGCPGGESPDDIATRVDVLIKDIREIHKKAVEEDKNGDVLCVAHAHILRSFTARWLGLPVSAGRHFLLDAGGVAVLWYSFCSCELTQVMSITVLMSRLWIVGMSRMVSSNYLAR
jgi:sedoheptulose-bisphosphatase